MERVRFELRMEAYNALNGFTPAQPNITVTNVNFGKTIGELSGTQGRQVQLSGRITF